MMIDFEGLREHIDECIEEINNSILNCIEKNEMIKESCEYDSELPEIFTEQLYTFCEYVSPDKDEITKWMDKKGYFYKGDKANKKKETMRMYQFLKQHKFDPKDETYESDVKEKDGSNKRIKLDVDPKLTEDEKKILKNKDKSNPNYWRIKDKESLVSSVTRGENAYFDGNAVNMSSKELKSKQYKSQFTLKHEEGHADSWFNRTGNNFKNENLPADHPANVALKEHKDSGKYVNKHDDSTEELMADLHMAMNGKIRTKHWGKNKTARHFNKIDILRNFKNIESDMNKYSKKYIENKMEKKPNKEDDLKQIETYLKYEFDKYCDFDYDLYNLSEFVHNIINGCSYEICKTCSTIFQDEVDKYNKTIQNNSIQKLTKSMNNAKYELSRLTTILQKVNECYTSRGIKDVNDIKKFIKKEYSDMDTDEGDDYCLLIIHIFKGAKTLTEVCNNISDRISKEQSLIQSINKELKEFENRVETSASIQKIISDESDKFNKKHELSSNFKNEIFKHIKSIYEKIFPIGNKLYEEYTKEMNKLLKRLEQENRETNELRAKFASSAIKEYFEELFDDDFYYD